MTSPLKAVIHPPWPDRVKIRHPLECPLSDQDVFFRTLDAVLARFQPSVTSTPRINIVKELKGLGAPEFRARWSGFLAERASKDLVDQRYIKNDSNQLTWSLFLEEFKHKYIGDQFIRQMKEGCLRVVCRVITSSFKRDAYCVELSSFQEVVNHANALERAQNERGSNQMRGRQNSQWDLGAERSNLSQVRQCSHCGKNHSGISRMILEPTLNRGSGRGRGRSQSESSTSQEIHSTARVYNLKTSEDRDDPEIITETTSSEVLVTNPLGLSARGNMVCRGCPIRIQGIKFPVNLMELPFDEFEVILGMDWLYRYYANVDYRLKRVTLRSLEGIEVVVFSEEWNPLANVISMMSAKKLLLQGCQGFIASKEKGIEEIPIVREFSDVFPAELPGLPPDREVELHIEVMSGTVPITMAPYRMAPKELQELKIQLQELLDKGFMRPSVSPWGAPVLFFKKKDGSMRLCIDYRQLNKNLECQESFERLKKILTEALVLVQPESGKNFVVYSDVSHNGLGCVLMQEERVEFKTEEMGRIFKGLRCSDRFPSGKANVVADALSRKTFSTLRAMDTKLSLREDGAICAELTLKPSWLERIKELQARDEKCSKKLQQIKNEEQVKAEYQVPSGLLQPISIPQWKWDNVTMDFITGLPLTPNKRDLIWVIIDRFTNSAHFIPIEILDLPHGFGNHYIERWELELVLSSSKDHGKDTCHLPSLHITTDKEVLGPELIQELKEKVQAIQNNLNTAADRQKSYTDLKRKVFEFQVEDKVFLKVSPWKKVLRFKRKGKLSPRFIGPYEIVKRVGPVVYQLALPPEMEKIHDVFHVSMLRKYRSDPSHIVTPEEIKIQPDLTYEEEPVRILAHEIKQLRNKTIPLVKVLWMNHKVPRIGKNRNRSGKKSNTTRRSDQKLIFGSSTGWGVIWRSSMEVALNLALGVAYYLPHPYPIAYENRVLLWWWCCECLAAFYQGYVGACLVNQNGIILGIGYNGFPRGCSDDQLPWAKMSKYRDPLET
ncbi:Ribosomal protein S8 family protein isoform 1 [Hibiscus syriacus]|uniref:Ribosomal protein S8 family protein isoform 1 n=1 Tax=Hibiscus syriacus TaxID=106335 RepID=A0A6A2WN20_HIBSY|nr:Ribosomal protein S8 family protein isoform 1 [Hibiscus syriacus]